MKKYISALSICLALSCQNSASSTIANFESENYPAIVDSLGVQELYDRTRWQIYLLKCQDSPIDNNGRASLNKCFGSLPLLFDSLTVVNDSVAIYFNFHTDEHGDAVSLSNYYPDGMLFSTGMDSLTSCYISNRSSIKFDCITPISREVYDTTSFKLVKPLQPDVIAFLNKNKKVLHPWLYKEAVKRGVIKDR